MKAYHITGTAGLDSLHLVELPQPQAAAGEVLVRIKAVSLNYRDYMNITGSRGVTGPIPRVPCSDGAGEIVAVGEGVTQWQVGDAVVIPFMPSWLDGGFTQHHAARALGGVVDGVLREFLPVSAAALLPLPAGYSYEEAATLPCAAVTAWQALAVRGQVQAGQTVLILGTGGVSSFALQIAKAQGARLLAVTSSQEKAAHLLASGADAVCNYNQDDNWDDWALAQTEGLGVDHVVEIGGPGTLNRSIKATRFGGHIALIGVLTGIAGDVQTVSILRKGITLSGIYVGSRSMFADLISFIQKHGLKPQIDSQFSFADVPAAVRRLESAQHRGKIVIQVN